MKAIPLNLQNLLLTPEMQVSSGGLTVGAIQLSLAFWLIAAIYLLGYGGLSLSIEGPSKVDINTEDLEDGTCRVTYCPTEPGNYIINIKFADQHVPGECGSHTPYLGFGSIPTHTLVPTCNLCIV